VRENLKMAFWYLIGGNAWPARPAIQRGVGEKNQLATASVRKGRETLPGHGRLTLKEKKRQGTFLFQVSTT